MLIPNPRTWSVNETWLASYGNVEIRDALNFLLNPPKCFAYRNGVQTITNATLTLISLDSESFDNDSMHSTVTNTSRVVFTTEGTYVIVATISYAANSTGKRVVQIRKNAAGSGVGGTLLVDIPSMAVTGPSTASQPLVAFVDKFSATDYIEMFAYQDSGGSLALVTGSGATYVQVHRLSNL